MSRRGRSGANRKQSGKGKGRRRNHNSGQGNASRDRTQGRNRRRGGGSHSVNASNDATEIRYSNNAFPAAGVASFPAHGVTPAAVGASYGAMSQQPYGTGFGGAAQYPPGMLAMPGILPMPGMLPMPNMNVDGQPPAYAAGATQVAPYAYALIPEDAERLFYDALAATNIDLLITLLVDIPVFKELKLFDADYLPELCDWLIKEEQYQTLMLLIGNSSKFNAYVKSEGVKVIDELIFAGLREDQGGLLEALIGLAHFNHDPNFLTFILSLIQKLEGQNFWEKHADLIRQVVGFIGEDARENMDFEVLLWPELTSRLFNFAVAKNQLELLEELQQRAAVTLRNEIAMLSLHEVGRLVAKAFKDENLELLKIVVRFYPHFNELAGQLSALQLERCFDIALSDTNIELCLDFLKSHTPTLEQCFELYQNIIANSPSEAELIAALERLFDAVPDLLTQDFISRPLEADPKDYSGYTAAHALVSRDAPQVLQYLKEKGMSFAVRDAIGRRPYHLAKALGREKCQRWTQTEIDVIQVRVENGEKELIQSEGYGFDAVRFRNPDLAHNLLARAFPVEFEDLKAIWLSKGYLEGKDHSSLNIVAYLFSLVIDRNFSLFVSSDDVEKAERFLHVYPELLSVRYRFSDAELSPFQLAMGSEQYRFAAMLILMSNPVSYEGCVEKEDIDELNDAALFKLIAHIMFGAGSDDAALKSIRYIVEALSEDRLKVAFNLISRFKSFCGEEQLRKLDAVNRLPNTMNYFLEKELFWLYAVFKYRNNKDYCVEGLLNAGQRLIDFFAYTDAAQRISSEIPTPDGSELDYVDRDDSASASTSEDTGAGSTEDDTSGSGHDGDSDSDATGFNRSGGGGEKENAAASSAVASVSELWKSTARNCKDSQQGLNVDAAEFVMPASS